MLQKYKALRKSLDTSTIISPLTLQIHSGIQEHAMREKLFLHLILNTATNVCLQPHNVSHSLSMDSFITARGGRGNMLQGGNLLATSEVMHCFIFVPCTSFALPTTYQNTFYCALSTFSLKYLVSLQSSFFFSLIFRDVQYK